MIKLKGLTKCKKETIAIHAGYDKNKVTEMAVPISQTTAYAFRDSEHAANLFALKRTWTNLYKINKSNFWCFRAKICTTRRWSSWYCNCKWSFCNFYSIANVAEAGDNIIISDKLYGGSVTLFYFTLKDLELV